MGAGVASPTETTRLQLQQRPRACGEATAPQDKMGLMGLTIVWHARRALWRAPSRRRRWLSVATIVWHARRALWRAQSRRRRRRRGSARSREGHDVEARLGGDDPRPAHLAERKAGYSPWVNDDDVTEYGTEAAWGDDDEESDVDIGGNVELQLQGVPPSAAC